MLDLIDCFSWKPVLFYAFHVFGSKLLQPHNHHVVIHMSKFTPIIIGGGGLWCGLGIRLSCLLRI